MIDRFNDLNTAVKLAVEKGLSVWPPSQDGSKRPSGNTWTERQKTPATINELRKVYRDKSITGIGLICGAVSGNLECFDFDERGIYNAFKQSAYDAGLGSLLERIEAGYLEHSPNGTHYLYKCSEIGGNTKLATRPKRHEEMKDEHDKIKTLIETRGQGGYIIVAPSFGSVNPTGTYTLVSGSLETIPTITPEERRDLFNLARTFQIDADEGTANRERTQKEISKVDGRPGDEFNEKAEWADILKPHGWTPVYSRGDVDYWRRPGKSIGVSGTTNHNGIDLFHNFSSSTPFDTDKSYTKFHAYAVLNHRGDFQAAAKALAGKGYGDQQLARTAPALLPGIKDSDLANAERLVNRYGKDLKFTPERGWIVWDGKRFSPDNALVMEKAKETVRSIYAEIPNAGPEAQKEIFKWARRSQAAERIRAMLSLAQSDPKISARISHFDKDAYLLNCDNGTIDLRTGDLREHRREDLCSKITPINYDPTSPCTTWLKFLHRVLNGNENLIAYLQRAFGYSLTGLTWEQILIFLYGIGANGKSVFLETLLSVLGEYAVSTIIETITVKQRGIPNDVARLAGARVVAVSETAEGQRLNESLVKDLTGGDTVTARFLHREFFDFRPEFKLWIRGNHHPQIRGTDDGIWRRIHLIPFTVQIPEGERDKALAERLRRELPGILAWAVKGCVEWQRTSLRAPGEVLNAVRGYRTEMDTLGTFLGERCVMDRDYTITAKELYTEYVEWCKTAGEHQLSQTRFGRALSERGLSRERLRGGYLYHGISLSVNGVNGCEPLSSISPYTRAHQENNTESGSHHTHHTQDEKTVQSEDEETVVNVIEVVQ